LSGREKRTPARILAGLLSRDAGEVSIWRADVAEDPVFMKERIGVVPDESNLYPELTCRRNLEYMENYMACRARHIDMDSIKNFRCPNINFSLSIGKGFPRPQTLHGF
jgi:ABC-type multidrug transport system ATPase subunit